MVRPDAAALRDFVRHTLGCGCPDEVLRDITRGSARAPNVAAAVTRIDVGGRLLVDILVVTGEDPVDTVADVLASGVVDRDRAGFNRYRLVLVTQGRDAFHTAAAAAAAAAAGNPAERAHIHVVPREQVPFL